MGSPQEQAVPWLVHVVTIATALVVGGTFVDKSLFSLHVLLMSFAFLLIIPEGVFIAMKAKGRQRNINLAYHLYVQLVAFLLGTAGFVSIFVSRMKRDKPHFVSWHAWVGTVTLGLSSSTGVVGAILYYGGIPSSMRKHLGLIRRAHHLCGKAVTHLGNLAVFLALHVFNPAHHRHKGLWTYVLGGGLAVLELLLIFYLSREKRTYLPTDKLTAKPEANDNSSLE